MHYILDTSVYSQPLRRSPVEAALLHWRDAGDNACCISIVTAAELDYGLVAENREERWAKYRALSEDRLTILETTQEVWREFARRKTRQHRLGHVVADLDLLIAATAIVHGLTVATLNINDFARIEGVAWEDWSY